MTNLLCRKCFLSLAVLLAFAAVLPSARAESNAQREKHERKVEKRLSHFRTGSYVQIDFRDDTQAYGSLGQLQGDSFQFTSADSNTVTTYSYAQVERVKASKEYIGRGSGREHHFRLWIPVVIGAAAAGGAVAAFELTR